MDWNPRYVAYAADHQRRPAEQLAVDRAAPACMVAFICWINACWRQWRALRVVAPGTFESPDEFDHWLAITTDEGGRRRERARHHEARMSFLWTPRGARRRGARGRR